DVSSPVAAGRQESFTIHDLELETPYFFALKTADDLSNWSTISNVAGATTVALAQLTHSMRRVGAREGCWSPNGNYLVFRADYTDQYSQELYRMPAYGGEPTRLSDESRGALRPAWIPGGNQLSFITQGFGVNELRVVDPTPGSTSFYLMHHDGYKIIDYSWSPDGNQIVYAAYDPDQNQWEQRKVYLVSLSGGTPEVLLSDDWLPVWVDWSPLGDQISFTSEQSGNSDIWVISATGENPTQLTINLADDTHPAWSPDGDQIAFSSTRSGSYDIWVMSATGENPTRLTFDENAEVAPRWSPDGKAISYTGAVQSGPSWRYDIWVLHLE
ncbi:MAG: hypothetical protein KJ831_14090, partial [Candidatus Eisenbacteria bacterium]|nr:hypothetical protein [Candidatus Eisenbacteria bacterium]